MFSRILSHLVGCRPPSHASTPRRRPAQRLAAASGQAMDALEGRVLLSTLYVDASAPGPTYNGASWATAYKNLQLALGAAKVGDEIRIADGTYKPTSTTDRTISFALRDGVAIRGGYAGYGASDANARDIALYPTILSGDIGGTANSTDNSYHVLTANGVGPSAVLDGVGVTAGYANGIASHQRYGGGLYATMASLTLINCTFSGNSASLDGGGIYNSSSSPTMTDCTFNGNSAIYNGGGVYNSSSSPTMTNCTFSSNSAIRNGGGMYNSAQSLPTLTNCIFGGNSASTYGGGIYSSSSSSALTNCTFGGNSAYAGGGMYNSFSSPTLTNCILWGNNGGAIANSSSAPIITCSDIEGGYAGTGNINADPLFVRSPWTGSDGQFGTADDDPGDLRLRPGSPALDVGSNTAVSSVSTDLAGNARIQNGTVDLGAYEGSAAALAPRTLYVDAAAGGANTGTSWANAFTSLASALATAGDGDTICMAHGTYKPTSTTDRTVGFALRNGVAIYGGYAGHGVSNPDARDIALHPTILSGDIGAIADNADNSYHVLTATRVGRLTALDGVTVTGGNNYWSGGGLYATGASPTLTNCTFSRNSASDGGGMCNDSSSSPTLVNCTFSGNSASSNGGGMCNWSYSSPTLINCTFSGNSAGSGGGMYNVSSSPTLANCIFSGNSATGASGGYGGGMYNISSSPMLTNCTLTGNSASGSAGGMYYDISSLKLTNCIVWGNSAPSSPQIYRSGGTVSVTYSDIQGGYAGVGNINADPLFVRNPSQGLDNKWGTADDDYGDLRLQPASPCVERGNNAATGLAGITTDKAGQPRFVDIAFTPDTGAGSAPIIDLGAYEVQSWCPLWLDPAGAGTWDANTQTLDIGESALVIAADDSNRSERLAAIRQFIACGRSTGAGIVSSAAGEDRGVVAAVDGEGNILVRVALLGDVTLDERIDGDDYFAMDMAFLAGGGWRPEADVNVDGVVDGRDYLMLDLAFLRSVAGGVQQAVGVPVEQAAQQVPAGVFSVRSIAEELLIGQEAVLA